MIQYIAFFLLLLAGYILGFQRAKYIFLNGSIFRRRIDAKWTLYNNTIGEFIAKKIIDDREDTYLSTNNTLTTREKALIFTDRNLINNAIDKYEREQLEKEPYED